jgi:hypothetical protein
MAWWCEDCVRVVEVYAEISVELFPIDRSREDIFRSLAEEKNLYLQCADCYSNRVVWKETPIRLPTFKGYTVDGKLMEFRKLEIGKPFEFIPFDSAEGKKLWKEMRQKGVDPDPSPSA